MKKKLMLILILLLSMFLVSCNIEDNTLEVEQEFSKYESQNDAVILIAESIIYFNTHKLDLNELLKNKEEKLNGGYIITKDKVYFTSAAPNVVELFNFTFYTYECDIYGKNLKKLLEVSNIPTLPSCVANDFCFYVEYYTEDALNEDSRRIDVYDLNTQEYKILERGKECSLSKYRPTEKNSYSVDAVFNGQDALAYIEYGNYDCVVLDIMMPVLNGIEVIKKVRQSGNNVPILILSAKSEISDKILGLDSGANYYLTKPFDTRELLATIRAITRTQISTDSKIQYCNLTLDRATYELSTSSGSFKLANKEFQMMEMFINNPNHIISTEKFMTKFWGFESEAEINIVWVYISYLRKKLAALNSNVKIVAHRNSGYSLEE